METALQVEHRLSPADVSAVRALLQAAIEADGVYPLSEHVYLHVTQGGDVGDRNLLVRDGDGTLVAYAHLDATDAVEGASAELVVHPAHRGQGHGSAVVEALLAETADGRLRLWSHGSHPAAAKLAARQGFQRSRVLWQMRRSLLAPLPAPQLPDGVTVRAFEVGRDEQRWVSVNNDAFKDHPDQGTWTVEDVRLREAEDWFDPAGFFLAERGEELVAFHWTKVHGALHHAHGGDEHRHDHDHAAIGEVYVVGVSPTAQGQGLGPTMTVIGLRHLRSLGLREAMLYVDEVNTNAIRVYERLGFTRWDTDICYER
jgi:mycothiol synthase